MHEVHFESVADFISKLHYYSTSFWEFRGHADITWKLIPNAGRPEHYLDQSARAADGFPPFDISRFEVWRESARAYSKDIPENDFECLAVAQHFGLATRLMDWSKNPLVALFFAVESCSNVYGCVYCYAPEIIMAGMDSKDIKFSDLESVCSYYPPPLDNRILAQQGVFTYHPNPSEELTPSQLPHLRDNPFDHESNLIRFVIPPYFKPILLRQLDSIGMNRKYLFADLDGLSKYVNWGTSSSIKSNFEFKKRQ